MANVASGVHEAGSRDGCVTGTKTPQKRYGNLTPSCSKYPTLPTMRGAFVIRLGPKTESARSHFEGSVEEVDTGKRLKFQSTEELLRFLGESFGEGLRCEREPNQCKE
jgi:hypothetical protein